MAACKRLEWSNSSLLLHANDPRTPFEGQLGALAELQREGKIAHLVLCNVSIAEVRQAQRHFPSERNPKRTERHRPQERHRRCRGPGG